MTRRPKTPDKPQRKMRQALGSIAPKKNNGAKEIPADMDLVSAVGVIELRSTARPELANVNPSTDEQALARATPTNPNPGRSSLTDQQRAQIQAFLSEKTPPSLREIARRTGASFAAVKHLNDQTAIETGSLANLRIKAYERRLGKRLPVRDRVEVYAAVVRGQYEGTRAADRLRALERIEALEGIVTAREQRESESNQVHVGPLFVLPANAAPMVDAVVLDVRPSQDEA